MDFRLDMLSRFRINAYTPPRPNLHATECCCQVNIPPSTEKRSYEVQKYRYSYRSVRNGYRSCGWWGWGRCTQYTHVQDRHPYTQTVYYTIKVARSCPTRLQVCCRGYVAYKRCCTNIKEMKRLLDLFESQRGQFESLRAFLISQGHNPDAGCPMSCGP
ncbi:unnamed protein product [Owenia fusiformis]|uniref:Uncharacterized protein n=1 Tax=Owenia fusiformis TaxID=6347 RepID=A0A8S4NP31_OWEFU|nr:unnamed protein product [Owenia fusiformis]